MKEKREPRQPPQEQPETKRILSPEVALFGRVETRQFTDNLAEIEEAIRAGDTETLIKRLRGQQLEQMIIQKGPDGKFLQVVLDAVNNVAREHTGKNIQHMTDPDDIRSLLRDGESGLSPMALAECCSLSFHQKNDTVIFQLGRLLVDLQDTHPLMAAHALNAIASAYARQDMIQMAQEHNKQALTLLNNLTDEQQRHPNILWEKMKIQHGLLHQRGTQKLQPDMVDQFIALAQRREQLGDEAHVGRTYLDAGRFAAKLGEDDQAITYLQTAIEHLSNTGYTNAQMQAYDALAQVRKSRGEDGRAERLFWKGVGVGEKMRAILKEEVEQIRREREQALKIPATCLVELAEETYLVEELTTDQDFPQFMGIVVDQEKKKNAEKTIRTKLANILTNLVQAIDPTHDAVSFASRKATIAVRDKGPEKAYFGYKTIFKQENDVSKLLSQQGLDKTPKDGYRILSWQEVLQYKDHFDERTQAIIEKEIERRNTA